MDINTCFETTKDYHVLAYYTHLIPVAVSFLLSIYLIVKTKNSSLSRVFGYFVLSFNIWLIYDLIAWTQSDYNLISAIWSLFDYTNTVFFLFGLYFFIILVRQKDLLSGWKWFLLFLTLPALSRVITGDAMPLFNQPTCEGLNDDFLSLYKNIIEVVVILTIVYYSIYTWIKQKDIAVRNRVIIIATGIILLFTTFTITDYFSTQTGIYEIGLYGLTVTPIFLGLVVYAIVRYRAFNVELLGAQALVLTLIILVGSQFSFIQGTTSIILTSITLFFVTIFGYILIRGVKKDIAAREAIQKLNSDLNEVNEKQADLLYFVTHQIKGFFATSRNALSLILEGDYGEAPPTIKNVLKTVLDSDTNGVAMVQTFLNASKLSDGQIEFKFEPTDIKSMVEEVIAQQKPHIESRGLTLTVSMPDPTYTISIDRTQMREVIFNTIDNAMRYTVKGGITVSLSHVVRADGTKGLLYSVADTGVGIDPLDMPKLFKKNGRGKDSRLVNPNSNGYGLFIIKNVVEAHHGRVWVESKGKDQGSTFFVELPE